MTTPESLSPILYCGDSRIEAVQSRLHYKMKDYADYSFTASQSCALNVFFDLAQEFDDSARLHILSVLILRMFFGLEAELYLKDADNAFTRRTPEITTAPPAREFWRETAMRNSPWCDSAHCYLPVRGKKDVFLPTDKRVLAEESLMGVMVTYPKEPLQNHDLLFLEKYVNRVGYSLYNRQLAEHNMRHILFVRKLAHDIGHNVITPNMQFKLMLNQLEEQLRELDTLIHKDCSPELRQELLNLREKMGQQSRSLTRHFKYGALFLESLLRQSHFDQGHYVLRRARIELCRLVVVPQFDRYRPHLEEKGIRVASDQPHMPRGDCMVLADMGLITQVLANLLSNAVKYCSPPAHDIPAETRCTVSLEPRAFPDGRSGVKVSVFTTGPTISPAERPQLFDENFRASNSEGQYGSGHGLFFTREIVAEHGGQSGYEPQPDGNIFYFILPLDEDVSSAASDLPKTNSQLS